MKTFKKGRNNLAATVFVPYDCTNNCQFCTSKAMYKTCRMDKQSIVKALKVINALDISDIVITGGEPFVNLTYLQIMLDAIGNKNIFINTTLPILYSGAKEDILEFIEYNKNKITGINVSRHGNDFNEDCNFFNKNIFSDEDISKISVPVKINCVINNNLNIPEVLGRWNSVTNCRLSLRADYTKVTLANLKSLNDDVIETMLNYSEYVSHGGCDVCFDVQFKYLYGNLNISYHRGLEQSSISIGNLIIVNDIIIKPNGDIFYDWDDKNEDISEMIKMFKKNSSTSNSTNVRNTKTTSTAHKTNKTNTSSYSGSTCGGSYSSTCGSSSSLCNNHSTSKSITSCGSHSSNRYVSSCGGFIGSCG